jgi:hypothetical protein
MYPQRIEPEDVLSDAEPRAFEAIRERLDEDWEAFHAAAWVDRDPVEGARDGEIDFCHPDRGILCLEVKGGGIESYAGSWWRVEHDGTRAKVKDPFRQALDHRYALERKIDELEGWRGKDLFIGYAVLFPFITIHQLALAPDAPREILMDRNDLRELAPAIERVLSYHRGARGTRRVPGAEGAAILRALLAPRVSIRVPLAEEILHEEAQLVVLTLEQSRALRRLTRDKRMVITGCAGSGKTMLAVEHARRLAEGGKRVLVVCFNRALAAHLRAARHPAGVDYFTFHALCTHLARKAKVALPQYPEGEAPQSYFDEELPEALAQAVDVLGAAYDALIVDEAQDLHTEWLDALRYTLQDDPDAPIWLFMDDNQNVYDTTLEVGPEFRPYDLTVNCRNTRAIHREVRKLYRGAVEPEAIGPEGRPVEVRHTDDQPHEVATLLERICGMGEVPPQDVVVLSSHGYEKSAVAQARIGRWPLARDPPKHRPVVRLSSIRAFKGLEAPVAILCELEDLDDQTVEQQLYVGISRAKNHCIVVLPPAAS